MEEDNAQQHDGEIKSRLDAMGIASEIKLRDGPFTQHLVLSCNALAAPEAFLRESVAEIQQRKVHPIIAFEAEAQITMCFFV